MARKQDHRLRDQPPDAPPRQGDIYVLRAGRPDSDGRLHSAVSALDVGDSRSSMWRALRITEALIKALEARGHRSRSRGQDIRPLVLGERVQFSLHERTVRQERDLTPEEKRKVALGEYVYGRHFDRPTGELVLVLKSVWGIRGRWADRKKSRLEGMLNDVVASMFLAAEQEKARPVERQRREAEWREIERQRQEEAARLQTWKSGLRHGRSASGIDVPPA